MNYSRQKGLTLIELMLASLLGVIVSYFIMNIMIASAKTSNLSEGTSQAQETGRLVMSWLSESIVNAGYNSNYLDDTDLPPVADLCTAATTPPTNGAHCTFQTDLNNTGGDRLAIRRKAGGLTPSARDTQTCTGAALPADIINNMDEVIDVFWISPNINDADTTNDYQLWCVSYRANGNRIGTAQSIAVGVESMQLLYGIGNTTGSVENFVSAEDVSNWKNVVAVRIAILAREFGNTTLTNDTRVYGLLDSTPVSYTDQTARFVQNGTIWFPNTKKM